eukprot:gene28672-35571_t
MSSRPSTRPAPPTAPIQKPNDGRAPAVKHEWAFQLHPGIAFQDFLSKCESLGGKGKVRNTLQNLRDIERDRYVLEVLGITSNNYDPDEAEFVPQNNNDSNGHSQHQTQTQGVPTTSAAPSMSDVDWEELMARAAEQAEASFLASQIMQSQAQPQTLTGEQRTTQSSSDGAQVTQLASQDKTLHTQTTVMAVDDLFGEDSDNDELEVVGSSTSYANRAEEQHVEEEEEDVVAPVRRVVTKDKNTTEGDDEDEEEFEG